MILSPEQLEQEIADFQKVKLDQGGFSHPQTRTLETEDNEGAEILVSEGMTIHMEFAKAAMNSLLSVAMQKDNLDGFEALLHRKKKGACQIISDISMAQADAMIKAYQDRGWL